MSQLLQGYPVYYSVRTGVPYISGIYQSWVLVIPMVTSEIIYQSWVLQVAS